MTDKNQASFNNFLDVEETPDFSQKRKKGQIWCPFCKAWSYFKQGDYGYYKCKVCGVSTMEFSVRRANCLWDGVKPKDVQLKKIKARLKGDNVD